MSGRGEPTSATPIRRLSGESMAPSRVTTTALMPIPLSAAWSAAQPLTVWLGRSVLPSAGLSTLIRTLQVWAPTPRVRRIGHDSVAASRIWQIAVRRALWNTLGSFTDLSRRGCLPRCRACPAAGGPHAGGLQPSSLPRVRPGGSDRSYGTAGPGCQVTDGSGGGGEPHMLCAYVL